MPEYVMRLLYMQMELGIYIAMIEEVNDSFSKIGKNLLVNGCSRDEASDLILRLNVAEELGLVEESSFLGLRKFLEIAAAGDLII